VEEVGVLGSGHDPAIMVLPISLFSDGAFPHILVRDLSPASLSDVKMMIRGSLRHVREHVAKPVLQQNANTCVFLQGDFV